MASGNESLKETKRGDINRMKESGENKVIWH